MGVDQAIDITADERKTVLALLKRHLPGTAAWVYGSRAKWTSRPQSDLDLVVFATPEQHRHVGDLREAFEESNLPFRVDLFVWDDVPHSFRTRIDAEHVPLVRPTPRRFPDGWTQTRLGNVITLKRGYDLPERDRRNGPVPVVSSSGITDHHSDSKVSGPGVVTGRYGTLGQVFFVPNDFWPLNTALYVRDFKGNDPRFISYFLRSLDFSSFSDKAAVPGLNRNHLHEEAVRVPDTLAEQRAIAHILGTLDDKIELNRRMNATLEAMARALFRSWFVDFDPVRAKMEGRDTGLPKDIADLFPDRLVKSELGDVPEGWKVGCVDDAFDLTMGQSPPGTSYNETGEGIPFYQGRSDFTFRFPARRVYCTAPTRFATAGDTLITVRAPVGDINIASEDCAIGRGIAATRQKNGARSYTYHFMHGLSAVFGRFEAEGTVYGSITKKDFHAIRCVNSPKEVIEAFEFVSGQMDGRIDIGERESHTLATIRDALVPKLISGEMRVKAAEKFIRRAV